MNFVRPVCIRGTSPFLGEFLAANAGLGYLIIYGQNIFNMSLVMTSLAILTVIAALMYYAVYLAETRLVRWRRS